MSAGEGQGRYTMEVPAIPAMLAVAREFAVAVCRGRSVDPDLLEDVRLGVTEAMSLVISDRDRVAVSITPGDSSVRVEVESTATPRATADEGNGLVLGTALLRALAGEVTIDVADGRTSIAFALSDPGD